LFLIETSTTDQPLSNSGSLSGDWHRHHFGLCPPGVIPGFSRRPQAESDPRSFANASRVGARVANVRVAVQEVEAEGRCRRLSRVRSQPRWIANNPRFAAKTTLPEPVTDHNTAGAPVCRLPESAAVRAGRLPAALERSPRSPPGGQFFRLSTLQKDGAAGAEERQIVDDWLAVPSRKLPGETTFGDRPRVLISYTNQKASGSA